MNRYSPNTPQARTFGKIPNLGYYPKQTKHTVMHQIEQAKEQKIAYKTKPSKAFLPHGLSPLEKYSQTLFALSLRNPETTQIDPLINYNLDGKLKPTPKKFKSLEGEPKLHTKILSTKSKTKKISVIYSHKPEWIDCKHQDFSIDPSKKSTFEISIPYQELGSNYTLSQIITLFQNIHSTLKKLADNTKNIIIDPKPFEQNHHSIPLVMLLFKISSNLLKIKASFKHSKNYQKELNIASNFLSYFIQNQFSLQKIFFTLEEFQTRTVTKKIFNPQS